MDTYQKFLDHISAAARMTLNFPRDEPVHVVTHMDCDGICSAALLCATLDAHAQSYELHIVESPSEIPFPDYRDASLIIFCDLGASQIKNIEAAYPSTDVVIIDHHRMTEKRTKPNVFLLNPHEFGIDGGREICSAGIAYLFVHHIYPEIESKAYLALIGMIGDAQEEKGGKVHYLNSLLIDEAIRRGVLGRKRELRIFGLHARLLHEALAARSDLFVPGITGNRAAAIELIKTITDKDAAAMYYDDLDDEEKAALEKALLSRETRGETHGNHYFIPELDPRSFWSDCRQISTILNACGRMGEGKVGVQAALGDDKSRTRALQIKAAYKKELIAAMELISSEVRSQVKRGFVIINVEDKLRVTIIGTAASMIAKGSDVKEGMIIVVLGRTGMQTKVSTRVAGRPTSGPDLYDLLKKITPTEGSFGGHKFAAGALFDTVKEKEFLDALERELGVLMIKQ